MEGQKQLYTGKNREEREVIGTRRMVTVKVASTILGKDVQAIEAMVENGTLRSDTIGSQTLVYLSQLEAHTKIRRKESSIYQPRGERRKNTFVLR